MSSNLSCGCLHLPKNLGRLGRMADKTLTPEEIERNRTALRHIPAWLRFRELSQVQLAERMDVSEATVSKWLQGKQRMSVGQFVLIAYILGTSPDKMLDPPGEDGSGSRYKELAESAQGLTDDELTHLAFIARSMRRNSP